MPEPLTVTAAAEMRRSIRRYDPAPVPDADLREILRVAGLAPSAWNLQPWRVTVVREPALKQAVAEAARHQQQVQSAPAVLVLWSDTLDTVAHAEETVHPDIVGEARADQLTSVARFFASRTEAEREAWGNAQSYIFLGFLLLAAQSLGYNTSPMLGFDPAKVRAALGLPAYARIPALVAIGKGLEPGFPHCRHSIDRFVTFR